MRFLHHPGTIWLQDQAIKMGGVTVLAVSEGRVGFGRRWLWVAGFDHRKLGAVQRFRGKWQGGPWKFCTGDIAAWRIGQRVNSDQPCATAAPILCPIGKGLQSKGMGGVCPSRNRWVSADQGPTSVYHPATLRSMFSATSTRNTAKARFRGFGFIACASRTPQGVAISVVPMTTRNAGMLTAPTV